MNTKMLLKRFQKALGREKKARYFYDHYIDCVEDEETKAMLVSIRDDEITHIEIAKRLIKCVS